MITNDSVRSDPAEITWNESVKFDQELRCCKWYVRVVKIACICRYLTIGGQHLDNGSKRL
jgi:hypothetical protein